jgi:hypothetical protein
LRSTPLKHRVDDELSQALVSTKADHVLGGYVTKQWVSRAKPRNRLVPIPVKCIRNQIDRVSDLFQSFANLLGNCVVVTDGLD